MMCTECKFRCDLWLTMKQHYRKEHTDIRPHTFFTKEAKAKA